MSIPPLSFIAAAATPGIGEQITLFFKEGGFFMILLGFTSIAGITAIVFKLLSLSKARIIPADLERKVDRFEEAVQRGETDAVLAEFERGDSALARLCAVAMQHRGRPQSEIAEAVQSMAREEVVHMHAGMTVIDVVIAVAPLLGLLGTASGLVVVFGGLGETADHSEIALGIGRALKTTIVGLAISVPAVIAQGWFQRRIDTMAARLEVLLTKLAHVCERAPRPDGKPSRASANA